MASISGIVGKEGIVGIATVGILGNEVRLGKDTVGNFGSGGKFGKETVGILRPRGTAPHGFLGIECSRGDETLGNSGMATSLGLASFFRHPLLVDAGALAMVNLLSLTLNLGTNKVLFASDLSAFFIPVVRT